MRLKIDEETFPPKFFVRGEVDTHLSDRILVWEKDTMKKGPFQDMVWAAINGLLVVILLLISTDFKNNVLVAR